MTARKLVEHVEHFQHRVMQDALAEATAAYWERRARDFDAVGTPSADETAQACRNRARVALDGDVEEFYELLWGDSQPPQVWGGLSAGDLLEYDEYEAGPS